MLAVANGDPGDADRAVAVAGALSIGPHAFPSGIAAMADVALCDMLLLDVRSASETAAAEVLSAAQGFANDRCVPVVAIFDGGQVDLVAAHLLGTPGALLCEPLVGEVAVALVTARRFAGARSAVNADEAARLRMMNSEVARIAETLARLSRGEIHQPGGRAGGRETTAEFDLEPGDNDANIDPRYVRNVIRGRRLRASVFPGELFADPAWDMLLDLFAAELENNRVSVSSLCIAASVPGTTALRWIGTMIDVGLFERQADPFDRRRAYILLTDRARSGMRRYFSALERAKLIPN